MSQWDGIDEFVAVAQARSFTQAAKSLDRSTSQLSRDIAQLEQRLGQRLLYRTTRHVSLTEAGERFLLRCRHLQDERDEALATTLAEQDDLRGQLRLTCSVAYGERFVVPIVTRLMQENPEFTAEILLADEVLDLVDRGIDLAVRFGRLRDSRLIATRLASRTRLLCASPAYIAQRGLPERLEELTHHSCLRGTAEIWSFNREVGPFIHRPHGPFRCNSGYSVLNAALGGLGLCQLPDFYVRPHIADGRLIEVLAQHRPDDEGVWAVYPDRRYLPAKVKAVVQRLHHALSSNQSGSG